MNLSMKYLAQLFYHPLLLRNLTQKGKGVCLRSAAIGDVVELSYQVRLAGEGSGGGQGQLIDGAEVLADQGESTKQYNRSSTIDLIWHILVMYMHE